MTNLTASEPRTYEDLAAICELPLLDPQLTEEQVAQGCALAKSLCLGAVIVRPSDLDLAARWTGPSIALSAAVDWPHGYSTTATKQYAVRDALRRGAKEVVVTMNTGKLVSRQFQYLEMELVQIADACHEIRALLTVNLQSEYLTDEHKIVACRIAKRAAVDFLATTNLSDIALLRNHARDKIQLKYRAADTLEAALDAFAAGCTRIESSNAEPIMEAWKARLVPAQSGGHA
jgi:deoxyribose-phosphate aldolase